MITQPSGNGVEAYDVAAAGALAMGDCVIFSSNALIKATSATRVFGVMLEDAAASQAQVAVAVRGAVTGKVKVKTSANVTAIGAPLYVGATAGAVTPTDPGSGVIVGYAAETGSSGDLVYVYLSA